MTLRYLLVLLVALSFLAGGYGRADGSGAAGPAVVAGDDGLTVVWAAPEPVLFNDDSGRVQVTMPGFESVREPGWPRLPLQSLLVALPPGAAPAVTARPIVTMTLPLPGALAVAGQPEGPVRDAAGQVIGGGYEATAAPAPFDQPVVVLEEIGTMRGVRLARVVFYPVRPAGDQLVVTREVEVQVAFNTPAEAAAPYFSASVTAGLFQQVLAGMVINPEQMRAAPKSIAPLNDQPAGSSKPTAVIEVAQAGMTAITYEMLAAAGFPVSSVNPHRLRLVRNGVEVAAEWDGDDDDRFEPGEGLRFYAAPWSDRWQRHDVYMLAASSSHGLRMSRQAAPAENLAAGQMQIERIIEENKIYMPDCICGALPSGRDGDRWAWDDLRRPGRPQGSYPFTLAGVKANQPATLTLWLIGFTAVAATPDQRVNVSLNGANLGNITWDGKTAVTGTLAIAPGTLQASNNLTLSLAALPDVAISGVWLDAFAVTYARSNALLPAGEQLRFQGESERRAYTLAPAETAGVRVYEVSDPVAPVRLTNLTVAAGAVAWGDATAGARTYLLATGDSLRAPAAVRLARPLQPVAGADYVVIAPADFMPAVAPLVALRQSQGLSVVVEDVQAIYDGFGYGRSAPEAIHAYLDHAYHAWNPAPEFILLVGDGTSDPKQYKAGSRATVIPPFLADADPWLGEVAADNRYVTVDGDDLLPDIMVGRLPVNSLSEAQAVVDKIVQYETKPAFGDWNGRLTLVADDADVAGDFAAHSAYLAKNLLVTPWITETIYHRPPATQENGIKTAIRQSWQAGRGLLVFTGHASIHQWGAERFFHLDDVATLRNGARLPVVLALTCFTGSFQLPAFDSLDEALLRQPDGGAVAIWGSTGLGVATGHNQLAEGFMGSIFVLGRPLLGEAVLAGKLNLAAHQPAHQDLIDTFTLLGDPATRYNYDLRPGFTTYLPVIRR